MTQSIFVLLSTPFSGAIAVIITSRNHHNGCKEYKPDQKGTNNFH